MAIALSILVLAAVLHYWLRRIKRILEAIGLVFENALNRAAANRGEPPIGSQDEIEDHFGPIGIDQRRHARSPE